MPLKRRRSKLSTFFCKFNLDDNITVELGESNTAKEIEIINASGQLVKRIPIAKGQKSVTFGAQGITRGLNMVRASGDKNNVTKIIIK